MTTVYWLLLLPVFMLHVGLAVKNNKSGGAARRGGRSRPSDRTVRNLVPQLLPNYTAPSLPPAHEVGCAEATLACQYRGGCGLALKQYMMSCSDLVHGVTNRCSRNCRHALIALISTVEGERLMQVRSETREDLFGKYSQQPFFGNQKLCS